MNKITVSAPGKLMLFGEHAVVYNRPCIVTAVSQRMKATVELTNTSVFELQAPSVQIVNYIKPISDLGEGKIPKGAKFVEIAVLNFFNKYDIKQGIKITTESEFSSQFGFGSSSAVTVCVIKALSVLFDLKLSEKELFDLAYKTVLDVQKKGSGFDVAAAIYGGTIYFLTGGKVIEPLAFSSPIVIGYSGVKADTVTILKKVQKKSEKNPDAVSNIYDEIEKIVESAKEAIEKKDWEKLGKLMNKNHVLLQTLGVSIKKLDAMVTASLSAGAYGVKLSGAGGGDCVIASCLLKNKKTVIDAINKVGGEAIDIDVNAEGVRVEL